MKSLFELISLRFGICIIVAYYTHNTDMIIASSGIGIISAVLSR